MQYLFEHSDLGDLQTPEEASSFDANPKPNAHQVSNKYPNEDIYQGKLRVT